MLPNIINNYRQTIDNIIYENDISYLALYGSYARGEQKKDSDLDLLVAFDKKKGLLDLIGIEQSLSAILGVKVDLITKDGLNKYVKPYIQDDLTIIYAKKP
ncbi:DNA polymerase beta [candidate division WWE3 bacterium CG_4_9_14_3_um_filter_41_6]|uniref:DNA polymerase beta n=1 Tax=candidate division WWE3 bacterium CG_4_10_14_0_2_um_filter_41_14 TaxID=1975072 RepID=A0A2M7TLB3_UNCKA|nr:MAG: DNA polymerase beta [candidate division WWE3 bacterium CG_4_10_14_0_2_um_filter_41_14]PJA38598.1 MAG: DNA polymerase beta [candidate division WWE3 bacterium CG_4_9_14_3_um_filter_41_6]